MNVRLLFLLCAIRNYLLAPLVLLMPRNPKKVIFGAWFGRQFSDNPKYFMLYLLGHSDYQCYWVGQENQRREVEATGARFVEMNSWAAYWHFLTAKWAVCNIIWTKDVCWLPTFGRMKILNLWHGIPLKKIADAQLNGGKVKGQTHKRGMLIRMLHMANSSLRGLSHPLAAYTSVSSEKMREIYLRSMKGVFADETIITAGLPRNDYLVRNASNKMLIAATREKYAKLLGLPIDKRWYLYLPTWRHGGASGFNMTYSFAETCRADELTSLLKRKNAVIIEKQHPQVLMNMNVKASAADDVFVVSAEDAPKIDMQELLLASDLLITDYSSCFFDFELLERPVIHFAYDYEEYATRDSGVEYDLHDIAAGPVVATEDELIATLEMTDDEMLSRKGPQVMEPIVAEKGLACEKVLELMKRVG